MTTESRLEGNSWEEAFMLVALAILIPAMLLAANLDLRRQPTRNSQQVSLIDDIRGWSDDRRRMQNSAGPADAEAAARNSAETAIKGPEAAPVTSPAHDQPTAASGNLGAATPRDTREITMMAVDFSLADFDSARLSPPSRDGASVTVTKAILVGNQRIGKIDITIESEGRLLLEAQAVRALLGQHDDRPANSLMRLPQQGLVSFAQLRDLGIDLRYSPNEDAIRLNP